MRLAREPELDSAGDERVALPPLITPVGQDDTLKRRREHSRQRRKIARLVVREVLIGDDDVTIRHWIPTPTGASAVRRIRERVHGLYQVHKGGRKHSGPDHRGHSHSRDRGGCEFGGPPTDLEPTPPARTPMTDAAMTSTATWRNWCGSARCTPARWTVPTTEDEIADAVKAAGDAGREIRVAGTGHSFNSLACTAGVLLDLSRYVGIVDIDHGAATVTVRAGTSVGALSEALEAVGLALPNMSTLAEQTVGGMLATGTHGTGIGFPPFAEHVSSFRLVAPDGNVRVCSQSSHPELFRHGRCALGTFGVITAVTVRCVPRFNLRVVERTERIADLLDGFDDWVESADHVSLSFSSWSDTANVRRLQRTDAGVTRDAARRRRANTLREVRCAMVGQAGRLAHGEVPRLAGGRNGSGRQQREFVDRSYRAFAFRQPVRFLSAEYALPVARVVAVVETLRTALRGLGLVSPYSTSVRVSGGADAPLSPAYGRRTGYVNLTVPRSVGYLAILRAAEAVCLEHDGRPHWGKVHTASAAVLAPRYPEWDAFQRMRAHIDPDGLFTSDYVRHLLGPVGVTQIHRTEAAA